MVGSDSERPHSRGLRAAMRPRLKYRFLWTRVGLTATAAFAIVTTFDRVTLRAMFDPVSRGDFMFDTTLTNERRRDQPAEAALDGLMLSEHAHRIANDMTMAIAELELCRKRAKDADVAQSLALTIDRLHHISGVQRRLVRPTEGVVSLGAILHDLCEAVIHARSGARTIGLDVRLETVAADSFTAWRLSTVVAEVVTNALKHGLSGRDGRLMLSLQRQSGGFICIVGDNGVGTSDWRSEGTGLGTGIINDIIEEMGGDIERRSSEAGTIIKITIPASQRFTQAYN